MVRKVLKFEKLTQKYLSCFLHDKGSHLKLYHHLLNDYKMERLAKKFSLCGNFLQKKPHFPLSLFVGYYGAT